MQETHEICETQEIDIYTLLNTREEHNPELIASLHNIQANETYTYKQLTQLLNEPYKTGNAKKKQLLEWECYFNYEKIKNKFLIKEIYETPLPLLTSDPANTLYAKHIKVLLLSYLLKCKKQEDVVYISSQRLYEVLGMVNHQYVNMYKSDHTLLKKMLKQELQNKYNVDKLEDKTLEFYINHFYSRSKSKISSIVTNTLNTLDKQNYITYSKAYFIYKQNIFGEITHGAYSTDFETSLLLSVERRVMDKFEFKDDHDIWFGGQTKEYWDTVLEEVQDIYPEIHSLYRCHKIIGTYSNILKALSKEQESEEMRTLNQKILNFLDTQAYKNMEKSIKANPVDYKKHLSNRYIDAQKYLSDKLIKIESL